MRDKEEEEEHLFVQRQDVIGHGSWLYVYTYWSHIYTDLGETIGKHWLRERMRNTWYMNIMSPMCSYLYRQILRSGWFYEGFLTHGSHISHESRVVIDIFNISRKQSGFERTKSLFFSTKNLNELKGLVRISTNWSLVLTNRTSRTPLAT